MSGVNFFNIEYLLVRVFDAFKSFEPGTFFAALPDWASSLAVVVAVCGLITALILLALVVYVQIRLVTVEHEGFHGKEEHAVHETEPHASPREEERWRRVMELASSGNHGDWRRAILEADIMLGQVLHAAGYVGESVGEQLRLANPIQMTTLDVAWKAHKVRNDIAHGGEAYNLTEREARTAINHYRRVFEEFGAV